MFNQLDQYLIGKFEKACDWFGSLTGLGNFSLARIAVIIYFGLAAISSLLISNYADLCFYVFISLMLISLSYRSEKTTQNGGVTMANINKLIFHPLRLIVDIAFLCVCLPALLGFIVSSDIAVLMTILRFTCFLSFWYLISCDTKPVVKSKIRQWVESLQSTPVLAVVPVGTK